MEELLLEELFFWLTLLLLLLLLFPVFLITFMFVPLFFWFPIKQASCLLLCNNCLVYLF